jgi:hypothetical protein
MIADDAAAAKRVNRDFAARTLPCIAMASVDSLVCEIDAAAFRCGLSEHKSRSRRRVLLVTVMHLGNFDIVFVGKRGGSLLDKLKENIDAERIVSALNNGNPLRSFIDGNLFLGCNAGCSDYVWNALARGLGYIGGKTAMMSKINDSFSI